MTKKEPLISVVMPVYNGEAYLAEAMESILSQRITDFEFIIINDGSTDGSEKVIRSFQDERIRYHYQQNCGLGATLNIGCEMARGKYIARQDQDDVSLPERFQFQIEYLESHPDVLLVGSRAKIIREGSKALEYHNHPSNPAVLKFDLMFDNPFVHSSVMWRNNEITKSEKYNPDRNLYEDYDLWSRFSQKGKIANVPEILLLYRHHEAGLSKNFSNFRDLALYNQAIKNMHVLCGETTEAMQDLAAIYHLKKNVYKGSSLPKLYKALNYLAEKLKGIYPSDESLIDQTLKKYKLIIRYRLLVLKSKREHVGNLRKLLYKIESVSIQLDEKLNELT